MRPAIVISIGGLLALALASCGPPAAAFGADPDESITVTSDSAPGWLPSQEQVRQARTTALDYLAAKDGGRMSQAYGFMAEPSRALLPLADYSAGVGRFNQEAGAVRSRKIVLISWTKDPAQSPAPGVYAALDLISAFANVDRHCGYMVLYQAPAGGAFTVMREEDNYLANAEYDRIARTRSKAEAEQTWARMSANCPNYPAAPTADAPAPLPETPGASVGYATVADALAGLRARAGVTMSQAHGWTIATDEAAQTVWSFAPPDDPSYPAVVKRAVVERDGHVFMDMRVLCEASKAACDTLVRQFQQMNERIAAQRRKP